jgi:hypothetical protein
LNSPETAIEFLRDVRLPFGSDCRLGDYAVGIGKIARLRTLPEHSSGDHNTEPSRCHAGVPTSPPNWQPFVPESASSLLAETSYIPVSRGLTVEAASACGRPHDQVLADNSFRVDRFGQQVNTRAFVGTNPENAANFCIARRSRGISAIVSGRLRRRALLASLVRLRPGE